MKAAAVTAPHGAIQFDPNLIRKLSQQGPRYTSYLTADRFADNFCAGDYLQGVSNAHHGRA